MIAGWIISGDHSVKDEELLLGSRHCKRLGRGDKNLVPGLTKMVTGSIMIILARRLLALTLD